MFSVIVLEDTVRVLPADQRKGLPDAVTDELNKKYSNRIKPKVGLCIRVLDIVEIGDGIVHACLDGSGMFKAKFRLIIFKPFVGEILTGKVINMSPEGLRVSMEFFDDILIPDYLLKPNTNFNKTQGQWVWQYQDDESGDIQNMDIDRDELIRFRVEAQHFNEVKPPLANANPNAVDPKRAANANLSPVLAPIGAVAPGKEVRSSAFWLECSIIDDGLGLLSWWS
ncbi:RNA polymerase III subunit Rpc25-domain-containing protein [Obelidium mucronatum]|nr:RNA polymerase III subunit Rpc25-domain-containing protein [Obelidium mucronatum]